MVEEERQRALCAKVTVELVENRAHVAHGTGGVVGQSLDKHGNSVRSVAFVGHFLVLALVLAHRVLDGTFDVVFRHILALRIGDDGAECRVRVRIGTASLHGDGDLLTDLRKCLGHMAPSFQLCSLTIFKCSSHIFTN